MCSGVSVMSAVNESTQNRVSGCIQHRSKACTAVATNPGLSVVCRIGAATVHCTSESCSCRSTTTDDVDACTGSGTDRRRKCTYTEHDACSSTDQYRCTAPSAITGHTNTVSSAVCRWRWRQRSILPRSTSSILASPTTKTNASALCISHWYSTDQTLARWRCDVLTTTSIT